MPRYVQFPRSNVAGNIPTTIDPGSFAVNWADRKIYTGGPNSEPILMAYRLSDFDSTRSYRFEDIMYRDGSLWRCLVDFTTGPFNAAQWLELTDVTTAPYKELSGTVWISGGDLVLNGGGVDVGSGSGVVMGLTDPLNPNISPVTWPAFSLAAPLALNATLVVGIDGNGASAVVDQTLADAAWRRAHIVLGWITTDSAGDAVTVDNIGVTQHQTKETLSDFLGVVGPFKTEGCEINLSAPSELRVAEGELFWQGLEPLTDSPNIVTVPTTQPFPTARASRVGYTEVVGAQNTTLDVTQWDNGTILDPVPADKFSLQFIFLSSDRDDGVALYGQKLYDTLDGALADVGAAWSELVRPAITANMILLGAVASNGDGSSQGVTSSDEGFGDPFGGTGGTGDTSQFLLITGTRPMTGDLDLGGNALVNGNVDGDNVTIQPATSTLSGFVPTSETNELGVNARDSKVYSGPSEIVADRIELFEQTNEYVEGDYCIEANNLYRATGSIASGSPFNPIDWQLIGADNTGALTQAVLVAPTTADRNTIDVTGGGGITAALKTTFDNSQSVDLYEFSTDTRISRFGIPVGAFGEDVFRISQVNHLFTAVGTPIYFNGAVWSLADSGDQARFPQAIVHRVIDGDNFLAQVGGRVNNLDPAAFVGDVAPTAGTYYYASNTSGKLTSVEGATPVPVLYALSGTQAIVKLTGTRQPTILTSADVVDLIYPVGSVYITADPANPVLRWPDTTWIAEGEGRALVGVGNNGESDWAVGEERGSETHTLSVSQMPNHNHKVDPPNTNTNTTGSHSHSFTYSGITSNDENQIGDGLREDVQNITSNTASAGNHSHSVNIPEFNSGSQGGGGSHNNVQPSVGIYMWRRTA